MFFSQKNSNGADWSELRKRADAMCAKYARVFFVPFLLLLPFHSSKCLNNLYYVYIYMYIFINGHLC